MLKDLFGQKIKANFNSNTKHLGNLNSTTLTASVAALFLNNSKQLENTVMLCICSDSTDANILRINLKALLPKVNVLYFSDFETLPYDTLSPHQDIISQRLKILASLPDERHSIVITTVSAIMQRLCPVEYIKKHSFAIKKGDRRDIAKMREELTSYGYLACQQVLSHGEFAVRGSILDVYPMGSLTPYRIDFFDDEVDTVRTFDIDTQRSLENIDGISILPAHEFPLDTDAISIFRSNYRDAFPGVNLSMHVIYQAVSKGAIPSGIEYYLPLFFAKMATFFDYLPENSCIVTVDDVEKESSDFEIEARKRALDFTGNSDHPPLEPNKVFLTAHELLENLKKHNTYKLQKAPFDDETLKERGYYNFETEIIPEIAFEHSNKDSMSGFIAFANTFIDKGGRILLSALSEGRRQSLREILPASLTNKYGIKAASSIDDFYNSDSKLMLTISPFDEGVILPEKKIAFLTESELFGFKVVRSKSSSRRSKVNVDSIITNLATLKEGQVVVHIDHGIGRYRGLKTMVIGGVKGEYLTIEYQNGDMLNIPITSLNRISRYSGSDNPPLSRLGNDTWNKKKQKAADKVTDVAAKLLDLYARREAVKGTSFEVSEHDLSSFASGFGYQETPDQADAIEKTLADLKKDTPMDRLVCGDVGFGKTEIALRAAFVVASCGSQVAMLVPTTILAEQHYQNFKERFAGTALNVELLSRFKTAKEQNEVIKRMESGAVDIVIGTHKLLNRELKFKKLGLLIIDEEHRFGVKQKEKLKELRAQVDLLTLTATPIPRTLNMAMEGMRELSIIATPPEHRLAVKTFVQQQSDTTTREAVMRELRRGGQVYYLHNDVSTIEQKAQKLSELIPEAKIGIGHGQLNERELQKVMRDFYHQRFNLLVCSTIIENGLDVSNANTIIIDRADLLGLAQLHQIRGRVGRSHHQAYAYFFTPPKELISKDAKLRLDAIASLEELGAGFVLATHDLEIRGAGELLGEEQSGQIESVGFSLYSQMLEAAVKALKEGHEPSLAELNLSECEIDLNIPCLFPDDYIADVSTRLSLYKRLSGVKTPEESEDLKVELIDRFGLLPNAAKNLFEIQSLKRLASYLGIKRIAGDGNGGVIEFLPEHKVNTDYLIKLMTSCRHNEYRLTSGSAMKYNLKESEQRSRIELVKQLLRAFAANSTNLKNS